MFYVINQETRAVLTYREGDRIIYSSEDIAKDKAIYAQTFANHPHCVKSIADCAVNSLHRETAPWLKRL